jgi:uncharacterized protein
VRYFAILTLLLAICLPAAAQAPLTKQQKIERILNVTNPSSAADEVVNQVRGMLQQLQPNPTTQQQKKRNEALDKISKISYERLRQIRPQLIKAYEDTFNDDEIDAMLSFYTSPGGRAATKKMPAINQRMSDLIQNEMNSLGKEINKIAEETLR